MPNPKSGLFDEYACTTVPVLNVNMKYYVKDCKERENVYNPNHTKSYVPYLPRGDPAQARLCRISVDAGV